MSSHPILTLLLLAGSLFFAIPAALAEEAAVPNALETALLRKADKLSQGEKAAQHAKRVQILKVLAAHITKVQKKEAGINDPVAGGSTALMLAVALGEKQTVRSLLAMGADPKKANDKGKTALDLARDGKMREILEKEIPLATWEEAEKHFLSIITKTEDGFIFIGENGEKMKFGGMYTSSWENKDTERLMDVVEGVPGASRLLAFLASQAASQRHATPGLGSYANWLYRNIQIACDDGFITEDERDRQVAVLIPFCDVNRGLRQAALCGNLSRIRYLIAHGACPTRLLSYSHPDTEDEAFDKELVEAYGLPIGAAASNGHVDVVKWLFEQGDYADVLDKLLVCSCFSPDPWAAKVEALLLEKGAKFTSMCVMPAIMSGRAALVKQVLAATKPDKATLTQHLVTMGRLESNYRRGNRCEVAKLLVQNGADIHVLEKKPADGGAHPLRGVMHDHGYWLRLGVELYETLIELGLDEKKAFSALLESASYVDPPLAAYMLERGADPEAPSAEGMSILESFTKAMANHWAGMASPWMLSVAAGKEMEVKDEEKGKALRFAITAAAPGLAEKMVKQGVNVESAFLAQFYGGYYRIGKDARNNGFIDVNPQFYVLEKQKDKLRAVSYCSNHPLYPLLCHMKNKRSAKMLAWVLNKNLDMQKILNHPIDPNGTTLLISVARDKFFGLPNLPHVKPAPPEAVAWLLKHGADPTATDKDGKTALDYATDKKKKAMLQAAMKKAQK